MACADELLRSLLECDPNAHANRDDLARQLETLTATATQWPSWISWSEFGKHLGALAGANPTSSFDKLHGRDLYAVASAVHGHAGAVAELEALIRETASQVGQRMRADSAESSEVSSQVIEKLLVGTHGREPRVSGYKGRGTLAGWIRATVTRTFLNSRRSTKREMLVGDQAVLATIEDHVDPTIAHIKTQYRSEFAAAFEQAIAQLTAKERGVLRYRFVDGATVETIASVYRIHRATAHRWLSEARASLAKHVQIKLAARLAEENLDIDEVRGLVESQLELSLSRMFAG